MSDSTYESGQVDHVGHGNTPAAWVTVIVAMAAFVLGGVAVMMQRQDMFYAAVVLLMVALVVGKVMQMMGLGKRQ